MKAKTILLALMPALLVAVATPAIAQQGVCPVADNLVAGGLYNTFTIDRTQTITAGFERLFRSDAFEEKVKNSGGTLNITVPYKGIPVEFGATAQFDETWRQWRSTRDDTNWQLDQATMESVFQRTASPDAFAAWTAAVQACIGARPVGRNVRLELSSSREEVSASAFEVPESGVSTPVVTSIVCSSSLQCEAARTSLVGSRVHSNGVSFNAPWVGDATTGNIAVNTTRGSTGAINVTRAPEAVLAITVSYGTATSQTVHVTDYDEEVTINGRGNPECRFTGAAQQWFCSNDSDRKWLGNLLAQVVDAGAGRQVRGLRARCVAGPCPWTPGRAQEITYWSVLPAPRTYILPQHEGGRLATAPARYGLVILKQWASPTRWRITGEILGTEEEVTFHHTDYTVPSSGQLRVVVPHGAREVTVQAATQGRVVSFPPEQVPTTVNLRLVEAHDVPAGREFVYSRR